ncbi:MAG TPA: hypothetical protein VEW28_05430, partial [Candidatus Kapabacteria bacterium]|nr:hypothetical protein [Candidatus Kapabacteria bacterium]
MPRDAFNLAMTQPPLRKKVLFICGSLNQTTQMHKVAQELPDLDHYFTPFYVDGTFEQMRKMHLMEYTILGGEHLRRSTQYLNDHQLTIDYRGSSNQYDLIVRSGDISIPKNTRGRRSVLVQEGMTDPSNLRFLLIKYFRALPRWSASTAAFGLSDDYDKFCVASEGYRDLFIENGVLPEKIVVTGNPNFDNCKKYFQNDFPHRGYVLACTSDMRETMRYENRPKFIKRCVEIAAGRQIIFKLHPNELVERATKEINEYAPGALIYWSGSAEEMIANCDTLITRYSTVVFAASALGKEIYSDLDPNELRRLTPM